MTEHYDDSESTTAGGVDEARRRFLRTSAYAAYATPLITTLLVEEASAGWSGCPPAKKRKCRNGELPAAACRKC